MAVGDDVIEDHATMLRPSSKETKQTVDLLSSEVAWADSCLIKDPVLDNTDISRDSLKDALLETIDSPTASLDFEKHISPRAEIRMMGLTRGTKGVDITALTNAGEEKTNEDHVDDNGDTHIAYNDDTVPQVKMENIFRPTFNERLRDLGTSAGEEKTNEDHIDDGNGTILSRFNMENVFLPTYNESLKDLGNFDSDLDSDFPGFVIDDQSSPTDIFKVWDLDTPDEEDELIIQLNKALAESALKTLPPSDDDSTVSLNLKEVDDLISGLADLSLIEDSV